MSYIKSISKSSSRSYGSNYEGIAILSSIGKLLESVVRVTTELTIGISRMQHDFMKARSVSTKLVYLTKLLVPLELKCKWKFHTLS